MTVERVSGIENYVREKGQTLELFAIQPSVISALEDLEMVVKMTGLKSQEYAPPRPDPAESDHFQSIADFRISTSFQRGDIIFSLNRKKDLGANYKSGVFRESAAAKSSVLPARSYHGSFGV